jgi:hypothetical protein
MCSTRLPCIWDEGGNNNGTEGVHTISSVVSCSTPLFSLSNPSHLYSYCITLLCTIGRNSSLTPKLTLASYARSSTAYIADAFPLSQCPHLEVEPSKHVSLSFATVNSCRTTQGIIADTTTPDLSLRTCWHFTSAYPSIFC